MIGPDEAVVNEEFLGQFNWHIPGSYIYLLYKVWVSLRAKSGWPSVGLALDTEMVSGYNRTFFPIMWPRQSLSRNHFSRQITGEYHPVSTNYELWRGYCEHLTCASGNLKDTCIYTSPVRDSRDTICLVPLSFLELWSFFHSNHVLSWGLTYSSMTTPLSQLIGPGMGTGPAEKLP